MAEGFISSFLPGSRGGFVRLRFDDVGMGLHGIYRLDEFHHYIWEFPKIGASNIVP